MTTKTQAKTKCSLGTWKAVPLIRPDLDDDPMGVYIISPVSEQLTIRYFAAEPEDRQGEIDLDAVHAENAANGRLIAAACNAAMKANPDNPIAAAKILPDLLAVALSAIPVLREHVQYDSGEPSAEGDILIALEGIVTKAGLRLP